VEGCHYRGRRYVPLSRFILKLSSRSLTGTILIVFSTGYIGISPDLPSAPPTTAAGVFGTTAFLGPLIGGITNTIILTLLIYCFSSISGAHFNPLITIGTLFARLSSLPRAILYVTFQIIGASLAGLMLRASYDGRDFKVGGCFLFLDQATVSSALATEFMACLTILFLAFGVGLDPRQSAVFGPALAPALVGLSLGVLSFGLSFGKPGYGGPSMNPARCFGVYVGSRFPYWHWHHWVAAVAADFTHALLYCLVPPWTSGLSAGKAHSKVEGLREKADTERANGNNRAVGADEIGRQAGLRDVGEVKR
jgi:glycerol uptake facilitator-like aquaporin